MNLDLALIVWFGGMVILAGGIVFGLIGWVAVARCGVLPAYCWHAPYSLIAGTILMILGLTLGYRFH